MSGVTGLQDLARLIHGLHRLSGVAAEVTKRAAPDVSAAAAEAFDAGRSPDGEAWPATKTQGPRRLNDSGALRAGATEFVPIGSRLKIKIPPYGRYQHPPFFWPSSGNPPKEWIEAFRKHLEPAVLAIIGMR